MRESLDHPEADGGARDLIERRRVERPRETREDLALSVRAAMQRRDGGGVDGGVLAERHFRARFFVGRRAICRRRSMIKSRSAGAIDLRSVKASA